MIVFLFGDDAGGTAANTEACEQSTSVRAISAKASKYFFTLLYRWEVTYSSFVITARIL